MKYLIFLKEFIQKKTTRNYTLIIFSVVFVISLSTTLYIYGEKILNDNYKKSYFTVVLDSKDKYNQTKNHNNLKSMMRCITLDNKIIVEYEDIIIFDKDNNIEIVSKKQFNTYEYNNEYYITLNNWKEYNDIVDFFFNNKIEYEIFINKECDIKIEKYYSYFFYLLILIIIISFIIYLITIINIILDEQKYNYLYYCLGFNLLEITLISLTKVLFLILSIIFLNGIIQWIIKYCLGVNHYFILVINILLIIVTLLVTMCLIIGRRICKI